MEDLLYGVKRKTRTSDSDSEAKLPDGKKICNENSIADDMREAAIKDNRKEDEALGATSTMEEYTKHLKLILSKLEGLETKADTTIETVNQLQTTVNKLENAVENVQEDAKQLKEKVVTMDKGVSFLNSEVEELQKNEKKHLQRIKILEDQIMYQELYNRRENLRFLGVPESMTDQEDTREVIYQLLEEELGIEDVRRIEFQRIHRIGKKSSEVRPVIARFLRFQDREFIFNKAREMSGSLSIKVLVDLPKEVRDRRKAQWPKLKQAREEGKTGYFSRREPDKLYINGEFVPM